MYPQSPNDPLKLLKSTINIFPSITSFWISVFESVIVFIGGDSEARTERRSGPLMHFIWNRCGSWLAPTSGGESGKSVFDWAADTWHHRHAAHHDGSHGVTSEVEQRRLGAAGWNRQTLVTLTEEPGLDYELLFPYNLIIFNIITQPSWWSSSNLNQHVLVAEPLKVDHLIARWWDLDNKTWSGLGWWSSATWCQRWLLNGGLIQAKSGITAVLCSVVVSQSVAC